MSNFDLDQLRLIASDRALMNHFAAAHPEALAAMREIVAGTNRPRLAIEDVEALTAIEMAVFDNWPGGRKVKSKPIRHGFGLSVTDAAKPDVRSWPLHFSGSLITADQTREAIARISSPKRAEPISREHVLFLDALMGVYESTPGVLFGLPMSKAFGGGTHYPASHALVVLTDPQAATFTVQQATLWVGVQQMKHLPDFDTRLAGGRPLSGKAILQSRWSSAKSCQHWVTG